MAREVRTDVLISAKTKGFAQAQQEATRITRNNAKAIEQQVKGFASTGKSMKQVEKEVTRLEEVLQGLAKRQLAINQLMEQMGDKAGPSYKQLQQELKNVDKEAQRVTRTIQSMERAFGTERERRQGFRQGLWQGAAPEIAGYLQRGPGMRRQMIGQAIGATGRRMAGGAAALVGSGFTGMQGVSQALMSIPGGGILAAPLMMASQNAQKAMQLKQTQQELRPYLGGYRTAQRMAESGERARRTLSDREIARQVEDTRLEAMVGGDVKERYAAEARRIAESDQRKYVREQMDKAKAEYGFDPRGTAKTGAEKVYESKWLERMGGREGLATREEVVARRLQGLDAETAKNEELRTERSRRVRAAQAAEKNKAFRGFRAQGLRFGFSEQEALQQAGAISQAGGGVGREMRQERLLPTALGAQRAFGLGPEIAGAFLQASRQGGAVGARGRSGEAYAEAIGEAVKMNLEGSDLTEYMQMMASDIRSWKDTGIPLNSKTIGEMGQTFSGLGLGGVRGARVGRGVTAAAQGLSARGIQGAGDLAILQELGGYKPSEGAAGYEKAMMRLEAGQFTQEDIGRLMKRFSSSGGAVGRGTLRRQLQRMGVTVSATEMFGMEGKLKEGGLPALKPGTMTAKQVEGFGAALTDKAIVKQASIANKQLDSGKKMLGAVQNFEASTAKIANAFSSLAGGPLKTFSKAMEESSSGLEILAQLIKQAIAGEDMDIVTAANAAGY